MKTIEIEKKDLTEKTKIKTIIFNPEIHHQLNDGPETIRIEQEEEYTRIDFVYKAKSYYHRGGWVNIRPDTFIRIPGSQTCYAMVKAVNIPLAPCKHYFQSSNEWLAYTLYFPALPKSTATIDIIEHEGPGANWFNFYGVSLEETKQKPLIVKN
jgi:hypothetical protein